MMRMHIIMAPSAVEELKGIKEYISHVLKNPISAQRITDEILNAIEQLSETSELGTSFSFRVTVNTYLRYLLVGSYVVIYRILRDSIRVIHIYNGRMDYLRMLFQ